jgi:DNA-binding transcriptional LysR family regulator
VEVLPAWHLPELNIHAITTARDYLPRKTHAFIEFFRKRLGQPPYWEQGLTSPR